MAVELSGAAESAIMELIHDIQTEMAREGAAGEWEPGETATTQAATGGGLSNSNGGRRA